MLPSQRQLFDIPDDVAYFNCGYMGPLMKSAIEAGIAGLKRKSTPWTLSPNDFFTESQSARKLFANLINADAEDIAIIPAASYGLAVAAKNIPVKKGKTVLILKDQFPSNFYCWQELCNETGGRIVTIEPPMDHDWTKVILEKINENTALAALPHNLWTDGGLLDLERIGKRLREVGAKLVLDVTQSLGAMPLDVSKIKPDFLVAAAYKWLLGPYSVGFMYVAPEHQNGIPIEHSWLNRHGSEDFSALVDYQDDFQPGAVRYDMGQRANFALMPVAVAALQQISEWGVEEIYKSLTEKTSNIAKAAEELGFKSLPLAHRAGHFLGLSHANGISPTLLADLAEEKIFVSARGKSLRITPHLYNNTHDAERLINALAKAVGK
ncbi:MAG: aminotransferase class V-fold PLP-dependent enzyme [Sneathiella sp.]|nr:aminotransferase class V-fold PLP-dependent enzyme [Sneathiella sp.]